MERRNIQKGSMIGFRLRARRLGGHVHVRVFAGSVPNGADPANYTFGNCGALTYTVDEWTAYKEAVGASTTTMMDGDEEMVCLPK